MLLEVLYVSTILQLRRCFLLNHDIHNQVTQNQITVKLQIQVTRQRQLYYPISLTLDTSDSSEQSYEFVYHGIIVRIIALGDFR
jgi:hypothetical protein